MSYGHGLNDEKFPGPIKQLAERLGVNPSTRAGYPGAVLLYAASLRKADAGEITARGEEVFRAFIELTAKKSRTGEEGVGASHTASQLRRQECFGPAGRPREKRLERRSLDHRARKHELMR